MAGTIMEKRTWDSRPYDIICTQVLVPGQTIQTVNQVLADPSSAGLVLGSPVVNTQTNTYPDGTVAPPNTVVQFNISGGACNPS